MKIIFISRSLSYECLSCGVADTSSKAFELGFINALKEKAEVAVLYLGGDKRNENVRGVQFVSGNPRWAVSILWMLGWLCRLRRADDVSVISTGYYPGLAFVLLVAKFFRLKSFSFVYDSHHLATARMPFLKKMAANLYFGMGFFLIRRISGLLVLNERFLQCNGIKIAYLKTRVGVSSEVKARGPENSVRSGPVRIVFAGTVNADNGTGLIIKALDLDRCLGVKFEVYGCGDGVEVLRNYAILDDRIEYFGRINERDLQKKILNADFLINLRDPCGESSKYAFPSKLINFMATGVPVISNVFPGLDSCYHKYLIEVDGFNEASLLITLQSLQRNELFSRVGFDAARYVSQHHRWDVIADEILSFIRG